jgi:hypothetical protein
LKKWLIGLLVLAVLVSAVAVCFSSCNGGEGGSENSGTTDNADLTDTSQMDFAFTDRELSAEAAEGTPLSSGQTVVNAGTYRISGSFAGPLVVDAGNNKVQIIFDNASLSCADGPAVYIKAADKVFITLVGENTVTDGLSYGESYITDGADGAIFSRADLAINGAGSLTVTGAYKHGIVSKDDLVITGGTVTVNATNVGISGKDCVKITSCALDITAGTDGIRSDNTEDANRGYVYLKDGTARIKAGADGIQASTVIKCENPSVAVEAAGKGIKASADILISGGEYTVKSTDDCVHSNHSVLISGGILTLTSGDDGIHADTDLEIADGVIVVTKSYEGLEGSRILISGGKMDITASDDGLNAAGGNDGSSLGGRPGMGMFSSSTGEMQISGGYLLVNAAGDGIDSNGPIHMSGGVALVSGPTNGGNGAFDCDGTATVTGGYLIAVGSNGMAQGFSSAENQGAALVSFGSLQAGTSFAVCDESGNVLISFTPEKAYQCAAITAPGIQLNGTYSVVVGGTVTGADANGFATSGAVTGGTTLGTFTMTSLVMGSGGGPGGGGGRPGGGSRPPR